VARRFAAGNRAFAFCDVCGLRYKLKELRDLVVRGRTTSVKACVTCWNPSHPQLRLGELPVDDPQSLRNPRPDQSLVLGGDRSARTIQWAFNPVGGVNESLVPNTPNRLVVSVAVGTATVEIT